MVEVIFYKMRTLYIYIILVIIALAPFVSVAQTSHVAGLEDNKEYVELLKNERELKFQEDSLSKRVAVIRGKFKTDVENKAKYSSQILNIEGALFDIRSKLGLISGEINSIEQEFIIESLNSGKPIDPTALAPKRDSLSSDVKEFIMNSIFYDNLSARDYAVLKKVQSTESSLVKYVDIYTTNYNSIAAIRDVYAVEEDIIIADSLYEKYKSLNSLNSVINDTISNIWSKIYDNKVYYYNLVLDKLNKTEEIEKFGKKLASIDQKEVGLIGKYNSDIICSYYLEKQMLLESEIDIAKVFNLDAARDSLSKALKSFNRLNYKLEKIDIKERLFIDYDSVEFFKPSKYNYSNPIPEFEIPLRGTVYKLLVGSYTVKQSPSIFRGAYPISYVKGENRRYSYYIGGFRTIEEAVGAFKLLKSKGFRNPIIVGWIDGVVCDVDMDAEMGRDGFAYRVQVAYNGTLPREVVELINESTVNKDISRVNESYTIGLFNSETSATRLSEKIKALMPDVNVTISEINL